MEVAAGTFKSSRNLSRKVIVVAAGEVHAVALSGDGCVYSWGRGMFGRPENGSESDEFFPFGSSSRKCRCWRFLQGQASTSAAAAASTATSSHSMGVNPQNQDLNKQSRQKEPVKRKSGAANASVSHTVADGYAEFAGFGAGTASASFAADAPAKVSGNASANANRIPRP
ncbi:Regulator of chromosome condensation 1/beta-lactamase-inhibitor protein II, partial [Corchorus capsularis]